MRQPVLFALLLAATALLPVGRETAAEPLGARYDSEEETDLDAPPEPTIAITPLLTLGAEITLDFESQQQFDLDGDVDDDRTTLEPELNLTLSFDPDEAVQVFVETDLSKVLSLDTPEGEGDEDTVFEISQAFIYFPDIYGGLSLQVGRQEYEDPREWLFDEDLDAARVYWERGPFVAQVSISREELLRKDLLNDIPVEDVNNYVLRARYLREDEEEDIEIDSGAYVIFRDDREDRDGEQEDLLFLGLQARNDITPELSYWAELSHVRSTKALVDVRGFGVDLGGTYVFDAPFEPSITLGGAFGTGDRDGGNDVDRTFRQTGLHDNEDEFNGETSFKYYGEVFDPELSNLLIATAGLGVKPFEEVSLDVVYHYYRQHRKAAELTDSAIEAEPDGRHRSLGQELDVVIGVGEIGNFEAEFVFGVFWPGDAFPNNADEAYFGGAEIVYTF